MTRPDCPKCKGKKHVPAGNGTCARCDCIREVAERRLLEESGVSPVFVDVETSRLRDAGYFRDSKFDPTRDYRKSVLLWLKAPSIAKAREVSVAYVLKAAALSGRIARRVYLTRCVDAYFDPDAKPGLLVELKTAETLVVEIDAELSTKMLPQVFGDILRTRLGVRAVTLFASSDDIARMPGKYGPEIATAFEKFPMIRLG